MKFAYAKRYSFMTYVYYSCVLFDVKEADFTLSTIVPLSYRYQLVDFPACWYNSPFVTLVPYPKEKVNLSASFKPLSYQVGSNYSTLLMAL